MPYLHPMAQYLPYVALAARYQQDSGDGDDDLFDYIEDTLHRWYPQCHVTRVPTSIDFSYIVETDFDITLVGLGTEGKRAWRSNTIGAFPIFNNGMHDGFARAGKELYEATKHIIATSNKPVTISVHSRGGPRGLRCQELLFDDTCKKAFLAHHNGPPLFTRERAKEYNKKKLPGYRMINTCDAVDDLGKPVLVHHKSELIKLPYVKNRLNSIPFVGWLFGGHAYSSDFDGAIEWYWRRGMYDEVEYLRDRKEVCTI